MAETSKSGTEAMAPEKHLKSAEESRIKTPETAVTSPVHTVTDKANDLATTASACAGQAEKQVAEWTATATEQTGETQKNGTEDLTRFVRRHPGLALLAGFGLGFLLGRITRS